MLKSLPGLIVCKLLKQLLLVIVKCVVKQNIMLPVVLDFLKILHNLLNLRTILIYTFQVKYSEKSRG
jgi:hypothetical protein